MVLSTQSLDCVLEEALPSLSIREEISTQSDPQRTTNPFQEFLSAEPERDQLESLIQDHLLPDLQRRQNITRLSPNDPFFQDARGICEREGWNGEGLSNYITLLCGALNFPAILLLNPSGWDHLPWDDMVQNSPTLTWIQQTLEPWGFTLRDIITVDAFPLLTDRKMDTMESAEKLRLSNEVFNLTVKFLRRFETPVMISCQCGTNTSHYRWGIVNHPLAAPLCSSVGGARRREVTKLSLDERIIHVSRGFHPMHIERTEDPKSRSDLDQALRSIFEALYRPCADWKDRCRQECEASLGPAAEEVSTTMAAFLNASTAYRRCQRRATKFKTNPALLGRFYNISDWIQFQHGVHSFVSTMLYRGPYELTQGGGG